MPRKSAPSTVVLRWLSYLSLTQAAHFPVQARLGAAALGPLDHLEHQLEHLTRQTPVNRAKLFRLYGPVSALALLLTTCWWSALGALTNLQNADQLVNGYLFESAHTLERANLPAQHSFLVKWPLFILLKWLGLSSGAFVASTILACVLTVLTLMWLIRRLEARPLYFGTLYLALASCLLLVPAQPYPGGLLPVNMAMTTTRNLEYMLFVGLLAYASNLRRISSRQFWIVVSGAVLLFASDRLFVVMAAGGALLGCLAFIVSRQWYAARLQATWLGVAVGGSFLAKALVALIGAIGITSFVNSASSGPYQLTLHLHNLAEGAYYALAGILTNLGANPAFDATTLRGSLSAAGRHLLSPAGPAYLVNIAVALAGIAAVFLTGRRVYRSVREPDGSRRQALTARSGAFISRADQLVLALAWAAITASLAYIATNHQYVVDARYLGIWLFCLFVGLAAYSPSLHLPARRIAWVGAILALAIFGGLWGSGRGFLDDHAALQTVASRNRIVVQALEARHTNLLIGDYWRVIPIRQLDRHDLTAEPLEACTRPRQVLSSKAWQPDLSDRPFAYLLSLDHGLTDFPPCDLATIISEYGRPSGRLLVAGTVLQPREVLLFYDHGTNRASYHLDSWSHATMGGVPKFVGKLSPRKSICGDKPTIMNIVAHQDDDILFMNPDISNDIAARDCVRTVYLTAGDAGSSQPYWLGRERGSEAAYSVMTGSQQSDWTEQVVDLGDSAEQSAGRYVTIASPVHNPRLSLIFMHLPDGGLRGQGFASSQHQSLAELEGGSLASITSIDHQSTYTKDGLVGALTALMQLYKPTLIRTQSDYNDAQFNDHSDHRAAGQLATEAVSRYNNQAASLQYYLGYPTRQQAPNLSGSDLSRKLAIFLAYARFDNSVCHDPASCNNTATYGGYLQREYRYDPQTGEVIPPTPAPAP